MKQIVLTFLVVTGLILLVGCGSSNATPATAETTSNTAETPTDDTIDVTEAATNDAKQIVDRPAANNTVSEQTGFVSGEDTLLLSEQNDQPGFSGFNDSTSTPKRLASVTEYRRTINDLLNEPGGQNLYSLEGNCLDHSAVLLEKLKAKGFDQLMLAQTDDSGGAIELNLSDGTTERAYKKHYFLVDRSNGAGSEIIIDPTIYQFVATKPAQASVEPIFVGRKFDLQNFYSQNKTQARHDISDPESDKIGKYDPDQLVCLIYSVDSCSKNRTNLEG